MSFHSKESPHRKPLARNRSLSQSATVCVCLEQVEHAKKLANCYQLLTVSLISKLYSMPDR